MRQKASKNKIFYVFPCVFLVAGVGLLIGGILWLFSSIRFQETAVEITGTITDIETYRDSDGDRHSAAYVSYEFGGELYEDVRLNSYSSSMRRGMDITLYCDPDDPWNVQPKSMTYFGPALLGGMGLLFALVGGVVLTVMLTVASRRRKIREQGKSIYATVEEVARNVNYRVNGVHPFVIYCTYRDDYKDVTYRFKSENLMMDPSAIFPVGSTIEVKVMEDDYSKYCVIVDEMDQKVIDYT